MHKITKKVELREFIQYLEKKYDLLNFEIDGVKPWQLQRMKIYYDLGKICGVLDTPHTIYGLKYKIFNILNILKSSIFNNPFLAKQSDIIIFPHLRIKNIDGKNIDIHTHYLIKKLQKEQQKFIEIENPSSGKHYKEKTSWRYYNDFIFTIRNIFSKFIKLKNVDIDTIEKIEAEIEEKVGYYNLKNLFTITTKKYKVEYFLYKKLFKKIKPKQIYILVSYGGFGSIIKVAKDLGIEVIELQHGSFSKYHLGYYYGEEKLKLEYFPDKFYVWNQYWKSLMNLPIDDNKIIIKGFDFLENKKKLYLDVKRVNNKIVVLSQGVIGEKIAKKILDNWDYFKSFDIKYKLHPGEYTRWQKYESLVELSKFDNVEILTDIDLYMLFSSCEYQVGVFSTALSEGVEFGCKTILLDLPGIEEMYQFKKTYTVLDI